MGYAHGATSFAGRETGTYTDHAGDRTLVEVRTTRYFRYEGGGVAPVSSPQQHQRH